MKFNKKHDHKTKIIRIFAALEHDILQPKGVDLSDMKAVKAAMNAAIEKAKKKNSWQYGYFKKLSKVYYNQKPKQKLLRDRLGTPSRSTEHIPTSSGVSDEPLKNKSPLCALF